MSKASPKMYECSKMHKECSRQDTGWRTGQWLEDNNGCNRQNTLCSMPPSVLYWTQCPDCPASSVLLVLHPVFCRPPSFLPVLHPYILNVLHQYILTVLHPVFCPAPSVLSSIKCFDSPVPSVLSCIQYSILHPVS